jgi:uncharacterized protein VirK/YbjX
MSLLTLSPPTTGAPRLPALLSLLLNRRFTPVERSWIYRASFAPFVALKWSAYIEKFYARYGPYAPSTAVLRKPLVEYAIGGLSPRKRLAILVRHYELFGAHFRPDFISDLCAGRRILLATLLSKGERFLVWIAASDQDSVTGEGEIVICLERLSSRQIVCKLTMLLDIAGSEPILVIGGLRSAAGIKAEVVATTRKLDGLRPKDALLLAARSFASATGFSTMQTISNDRHVEKSGGKLFADFDSYWLERGAQRGGRYGFILSAEIPSMPGQSRRDALKQQIVEDVHAIAAHVAYVPRTEHAMMKGRAPRTFLSRAA